MNPPRPCAHPGRIVWISARLPAMVAGCGFPRHEAIMIRWDDSLLRAVSGWVVVRMARPNDLAVSEYWRIRQWAARRTKACRTLPWAQGVGRSRAEFVVHGHKDGNLHGFSSTTNSDWPKGGRTRPSRRDRSGTTKRSKISICLSDWARRLRMWEFTHQPKKPIAFM
jgi:hypothetical protein